MLIAEIAGDCIEILQLPVLIPVCPAYQKAKEGFLCQIFCYVSVVKTKIQVLENRKEFLITLPLDKARQEHVITFSIIDPGQIIQKITYAALSHRN